MYDFRIAESRSFKKLKPKIDIKTLSKIKAIVYPQLSKNPFFGPNIKKLKGNLDDYYRFRIGNYRLFYLIDDDKKLVIIITLQHRKDAYD